MSFDHVKTIARYLQWAGFLAIPRGALDGDSRLLVNEYVLEPSSIEEWMDKQLLEFNVDKITFDPANQAANTYSTPLIALLGDAIRELYMGQDRSALPEKNDLTQWLQSKTIDGKKLSKAMCDAFYQILKAPDRRRAPPRRRSSDLVEDSNPQQGGVEVETKEPAGSVDIATKTSKTRKKTSSKKVAAKKSTAKKASTKKTSTKKTPAKKLASKKSTAKKKATSKKASAKKTPAKKVSAKKVSAKKVSKKKATAKKTATKKKTTSKKTTARKSATQKTSNSEIENTSESSDKT
ncbi:MAG: histone H1-like repetitive region-containing protein [Pseudomonadota bacterium]